MEGHSLIEKLGVEASHGAEGPFGGHAVENPGIQHLNRGEHIFAESDGGRTASEKASDATGFVDPEESVGRSPRIVAQHQRDGGVAALVFFEQSGQRNIRDDIGIQDQQGAARVGGGILRSHALRGLANAPAAIEQFLLDGVAQSHTELTAIAQFGEDFLPQVMNVDHDIGNSMGLEQGQAMLDQAFAPGGHQRFGGRVGQGAEAGAPTGRQNDGTCGGCHEKMGLRWKSRSARSSSPRLSSARMVWRAILGAYRSKYPGFSSSSARNPNRPMTRSVR